jgi:hypothetical protein
MQHRSLQQPYLPCAGLAAAPGFGPNHVVYPLSIQVGEWIYTVTIANETTSTFEFVLFYKRLSQNGVVFLQESNVAPNDMRVFRLGVCKEMESYTVGFFIGTTLVAQLPAPGTGAMTPTRASQENPFDNDICADAWAISPTPNPA